MRYSRRLRSRIASERRARIRILAIAIYSPRSISGPAATPAPACIRICHFSVEVCEILLLGLRAWLGAWNLAAARSATNTRLGCSSERRFTVCLYDGLFVFRGRLVVA